jgi:hypothetical protein
LIELELPTFKKKASRYEKAHETSIIMSATRATKIISRLDLRTRRPDGGAPLFSSRLNGDPLTASTNRKSFTYGFYQIDKPDNSNKRFAMETNLLPFIVMLKNTNEYNPPPASHPAFVVENC